MKKIEVTIQVSEKGFVIEDIKSASPKNMLLIKNTEEKLINNERNY